MILPSRLPTKLAVASPMRSRTLAPLLRRWGLPVCSICLRVHARGTWLEPGDAIRELRTYESAVPPRLRAAICPECETQIAYRRVA
jgi:hypothetical protein